MGRRFLHFHLRDWDQRWATACRRGDAVQMVMMALESTMHDRRRLATARKGMLRLAHEASHPPATRLRCPCPSRPR